MVIARVLILMMVTVMVPAILAQHYPCRDGLAIWSQKADALPEYPGSTDSAMQEAKQLRTDYERCGLLRQTSAYAQILHKIGWYKWLQNNYQGAIEATQASLAINRSGRQNCDSSLCSLNYRMIAFYYWKTGDHPKALLYCDSAGEIAKKYFSKRAEDFYKVCRYASDINKNDADYQEALNWALRGAQQTGAPGNAYARQVAELYQKAAFASAELAHTNRTGPNRFREAREYLVKATAFFKGKSLDTNDILEQWKICKITEVIIDRYDQKLENAIAIIEEVQDSVKKYKNYALLWDVLYNKAKYYAESKKDFQQAMKIYLQINDLKEIAKADSGKVIDLYNDIGFICSNLGNEIASEKWFRQAFRLQAGPYAGATPYTLPTLSQIASRPGKSRSFICLHNWAELMTYCYRHNRNSLLLNTSEKAFLLADSLFTNMRHTQPEETSQLYWRTKSRNFYQQALEMCWEKKDAALAFKFMEKSRAALLNDALSEIKARQHLTDSLINQEDSLKERVKEKEADLQKVPFGKSAYRKAFTEKETADRELSDFISRLEHQYPQYYGNKFTDQTIKPGVLQQYLKNNHQQWVQYFLSDTLLFVLYANGSQLQLYRQPVKHFEQTLPWFLNKCADEKYLAKTDSFSLYVQTAAYIYDTLMGQLPLQKGRLIVSPDNIIIPFDALCKDAGAARWMVNDYVISYAYSARSLLNPPVVSNEKGKGNFLGMAPVKFAKNNLRSLLGSEKAIEAAKQYYSDPRIYTGEAADSKTLLSHLGKYAVVNLLTHASGSSSDTSEPRIYMADVPVHLSELQQISSAATQLVILTACETAAGKTVTGEGVFSFARGFTMCGTPAVIATLWNADEKSTYPINDSLNKYISQGMPIDSALQKAKLGWLQQNPGKSPYYWANLTLMGNAKPVKLQAKSDSYMPWLVLFGCLLVGPIAWLGIRKRKQAA